MKTPLTRREFEAELQKIYPGVTIHIEAFSDRQNYIFYYANAENLEGIGIYTSPMVYGFGPG